MLHSKQLINKHCFTKKKRKKRWTYCW